MKRILIDMDHVMAEITSQYLAYYKERTGKEIDKASLNGKPETEAFPDGKLVKAFLHTPGFFRTAPVIAGSQEVIKLLNEHYEVFIVSAAMEFPQSLIEKYEWLQEHFPFISWQQVTFCGSKRITHGDYMIDDHLKNLDHFNGEKLLFTAPHNINITKYTRVNNWQEVAGILLPGHTGLQDTKLQQEAAV